MLIDLSQAKQTYIEDCEVCCNPIQIQLRVDHKAVQEFQATSIEQ